MVPCTRPVHLTWYHRRWKSSVSQQIDKKSPKAGFVIQQLIGLKPNRANFQNILGRLAEKGRPDLIVEAFAEQIRNQSFALDHRDFTAGILACGRSKLWQHACWLLHKMPEAMVVMPTVRSYNAAISACGSGGQWEQAVNLFQAMPKA